MTGLDTNVLVRYFAQDDPIQSKKAAYLIETRLTEDEPGFVSVVALVEMVWVLRRVYSLSDSEIAAIIERMLQSDTLFLQNEQEVFAAAISLKIGCGSFADALIGVLGLWSGCRATITFDRKAARLSGFELLEA